MEEETRRNSDAINALHARITALEDTVAFLLTELREQSRGRTTTEYLAEAVEEFLRKIRR